MSDTAINILNKSETYLMETAVVSRKLVCGALAANLLPVLFPEVA